MSDAQRTLHQAVGGMLDDGELAISWTLTVDVAGPDGRRYLAHRAGGGAEGEDRPMAWAALGMLRASMQVAEQQLREATDDPPEDGEND